MIRGRSAEDEKNLAGRPLNGYYRRKGEDMNIEVDREEDGRWIAEVPDLPGVMVYGVTQNEAVAKAEALALRVIADRLDHGEMVPELSDLFAVPA